MWLYADNSCLDVCRFQRINTTMRKANNDLTLAARAYSTRSLILVCAPFKTHTHTHQPSDKTSFLCACRPWINIIRHSAGFIIIMRERLDWLLRGENTDHCASVARCTSIKLCRYFSMPQALLQTEASLAPFTYYLCLLSVRAR